MLFFNLYVIIHVVKYLFLLYKKRSENHIQTTWLKRNISSQLLSPFSSDMLRYIGYKLLNNPQFFFGIFVKK